MRFILLLMAIVFTVGCAYGNYKGPDGGELTYMRLWNQKVTGVDITAPEGLSVKFDQQESDNQALVQLLTELVGRLP